MSGTTAYYSCRSHVCLEPQHIYVALPCCKFNLVVSRRLEMLHATDSSSETCVLECLHGDTYCMMLKNT